MRILKRFFDTVFLRFLRRNEFESQSLRAHFIKKYGISVGMYSYGCFDPSRFPKGVVVGRYCSFARTATIFNGNHGVEFLTTHPYLYNTALGLVNVETISRTRCIVGDDVWLGHNSIVLPSVSSIGRGAIVAAGAVVTKDVPPYAVVAGNPARVVKYRFNEELIEKIEASRWWEWDKRTLADFLSSEPDVLFRPNSDLVSKIKS